METPVWLERVTVLGAGPGVGTGRATLSTRAGAGEELEVKKQSGSLVIRRPGVSLDQLFSITLH